VPWEALIIPLIALAVWILGAIFRGGEQQQERERRPRPGPEGGRARPPRRPTSELDRFLEEARARRKPAPPVETERSQPEPVMLEAVPVETPPEKPRERPPPSPERRPKPRPPVATTTPVAPPVRVPVAQPLTMPAPVVPAPPPPGPVMEMAGPTQKPQGEPAPAISVPPTRLRRPSAAALKLLEMLRDKQSLATAVMLREVFDRPVALRGSAGVPITRPDQDTRTRTRR
jgi:hypothetical protein